MAKKKLQSVSASVGGDFSGNLIIGDGNAIQINAPASPRLDSYTPLPFPLLNELPEPGQLPPGSRMPFHRNAVFTGREYDLKALAQLLVTHHSSAATAITQTAAATGMGGIGKTQLAVEFCYRYGRYFHGVHWINARDGSLDSEIAACGREMGLPNFPETTPEQVALTLREWQKQPLRLVVLDNLEQPKVLSGWLPRLNGLRLLVTARRQQWSADLGVEVHPLDTLPRLDSLVLLRKLAPRLKATPDADLESLAERLGDLPLALDLAGRYLLARPTLTIVDYLQRLDETGNALEHTSLAGWVRDASPTAHETSLAATFLLSWQQLGDSEVDGLAKAFFIGCGYLAPSIPIPHSVFSFMGIPQNVWSLAKKTGDKIYISEFSDNVDDAISCLQVFGLLTETLALHPLLAEFARAQERNNFILTTLADKMVWLSKRALDTGIPADFEFLRPHLEAFVPVAERTGLADASRLWNNLGSHQWMVAEYSAACATYERALAIEEKNFGKEHPTVAISVNNLGSVLHDLGNLPGAKAMYERALVLDENIHGKEHPNVARVVNNLGSVLHDLGDLPGAKACHERALEIGERALGKEHPSIAIWVNNLGVVLKDMGNLMGAKACYERALAIDEKTYGNEHPSVAKDINNLGDVLHDLGDLMGAKVYYERALAILEKHLGVQHPNVAALVNNLGTVLQDMGDLPGAKACFKRALVIYEKISGKEHPNVARCFNNLGGVQKGMGDLLGAKSYFERALAIDEKVFGKEHPNVARELHNLAILRAEMDDLPQAFDLEQRALVMLQKFLPPEHPNIENARLFLADFEHRMNSDKS